MFLGSLYCKQYELRSDCSQGSGFMLFASMKKSSHKEHYTADVKRKHHFQEKKIVAGYGLIVHKMVTVEHI